MCGLLLHLSAWCRPANAVSLSGCLSFPFVIILKCSLPQIPDFSLPPSFLALGPCLLSHWEDGIHQTRTVYIFFPTPYTNPVNILTHPPHFPEKRGHSFHPRSFLPVVRWVSYSSTASSICLACVFSLSHSTEIFTSSCKRALLSPINM